LCIPKENSLINTYIHIIEDVTRGCNWLEILFFARMESTRCKDIRYALSVLKFYSARNVNYRFSVPKVYIGTAKVKKIHLFFYRTQTAIDYSSECSRVSNAALFSNSQL